MLRQKLLLGCALVLLSFPCFASGTTADIQPTQQVVMSLEQYNNLKLTVTQLEINLTTLEQNSNVDKQQLQTLKEQLTTCQDAISKAQTSLTIANSALTDLKANLQTLTVQINSLKHKLEVKERQNKIAWVVAGGAIIVAIGGHK